MSYTYDMNIGFDGSRAFIANRTGTENYSYQLLKNLSLLDQSNNYYIFLRPASVIPAKAGIQKDWIPDQVRDDNNSWPKNFHFITIHYPRFWTQIGLAHQTFKDPKLDLLFVPSHTLPIVRKPGLKTVITVHDLGAQYLPQTHQIKQRLYLNLMTHSQLKSASHIIAVSEATKKDIIKKVGINPSKITVVYEGFDKNLYKPQKTDQLLSILNEYDLQKDLYFLFVGTIQPRKNLVRLIEAYAKFLDHQLSLRAKRSNLDSGQARMTREEIASSPSAPRNDSNIPKLILAGSKGWLSDEIYNLPKKLGVEQYVKFLGYVPLEDLPALYSGAKAFLFPSLFEGFGLPILEAMACGCPVLTSNVSSMPEVGGKAALYVDPYSVDEITKGILNLYQNSHLTDQMRLKGFDRIKNFSWQKCAKETLEVLQKVSNDKAD